jgi:hypothetical protein
MKITKVSYRELKSGPGFSHQAIEMEASLEPGVDFVGDVLDELRDRVRAELASVMPPQPGLTPVPHTNEIVPPLPNAQLRAIADEIMQALTLPMMDMHAQLQQLADRLGYLGCAPQSVCSP